MPSLQAQKRIPRFVDFGVLGGVAMSNYNFSPTVQQNMHKGYTMGVAMRYTEEEIFGIQAELLVTQRGWQDKYEINPDLQFSRSLTYLELPLMAHLYFPCGQKNEINFDLGPKLAYFLTDKTQSNLPSDFGLPGTTYEKYQYMHHCLPIHNRFDYGIQMGLGYEFKLNKQLSIQLQGRYHFGLGNIFHDAKSDDFENSSNHTVQIVAAVWWKRWVRGKRVNPESH